MGRHHVKLPDHLYLSPPSPQPHSPLATAAALLSLKSGTSPAALIQETSSTALAVGGKIPGFRTSAAFLTTLRANIYLDNEHLDSLTNTPDCLRPTAMTSSVSSLPSKDSILDSDLADFAPPAALNLPKPTLSEDAPEADPSQPSDPNEIPPLTTFPAIGEKDRTWALHLVADSVAQQRQRASRTLLFHPITLALFVALFAAVFQYFPHDRWAEYTLIGTTYAGIIMTIFISIRYFAGGYIDEAERVGTWRWLDEGRSSAAEQESGNKVLGAGDEILVTKFGQEYIGTIVFRGVEPTSSSSSSSPDSPSTKKHKKSSSASSTGAPQARTEIRAWTVAQKYRNKGVGTALLEDTIQIASEKGWLSNGASSIAFAHNHANSKRVLPAMFNGSMSKDEEKARLHLEKKALEFESSGSASVVGSAGVTGASTNESSKKGRKRKG